MNQRTRKSLLVTTLVAGLLALAGCSTTAQAPMPPVARVDLERFMGPWFVIAAIPSFPERDAFNAVETYSLLPDGRIQTVFRYRPGGFDQPEKTMRPVGRVVDGTNNAVWGMQFIWPIQAEYVIADLADDYSTVIVGRSKRDYVWIMARTPTLPEARLAALKARVAALGYSLSELRMVPQRW